MKGPAGAGKSAIAQTCAEKLKGLGCLGASFFFSINSCDDHTYFFPSIAYQLAIELPEYRQIIDRKVHADKTLIKKSMKAQFEALLVEPLKELERQGSVLGRRAIFVDGLDECKSRDAQCEIIGLVATFARERPTPFFWAFFSRPEPHLQATFANFDHNHLCNVAVLSVSRDTDGEIELYLRNGLKNILRRRNITLSYMWPPDRALKVLVASAAGLFIYPATIIRFVDQVGRTPEELLDLVLSSSGSLVGHLGRSNEPFAELDAFYTLILRRIPENLLPSVQLLLALACMTPFESCVWGTVGLSNMLGFSEAKFRLVYNELHAVLHFQEYKVPSLPDSHRAESFDTTRLCDAGDLATIGWLHQSASRLGGILTFYHKSFYDFLRDQTRSGPFCVSTPHVLGELFKLRLRIHHDYARTFTIQDQNLIQSSGVPSSTGILSWPGHNELVNSYIKAVTFNNTGFALLHVFFPYDNLDPNLVSQLADFDFRKHLLSQPYIFPDGYISRSTNLGLASLAKYVRGPSTGTVLCHIPPSNFHVFDAKSFYERIRQLERHGIIRKMHLPDFIKRWKRLHGKSRGKVDSYLYKKGHGEKKTYWYWEVNLEIGYYQEFETDNLVEGIKVYGEEDFEGWYT